MLSCRTSFSLFFVYASAGFPPGCQSLCLSVQLDPSVCLFGCYCLSVCISVSSYFYVSVIRSDKSFNLCLLTHHCLFIIFLATCPCVLLPSGRVYVSVFVSPSICPLSANHRAGTQLLFPTQTKATSYFNLRTYEVLKNYVTWALRDKNCTNCCCSYH